MSQSEYFFPLLLTRAFRYHFCQSSRGLKCLISSTRTSWVLLLSTALSVLCMCLTSPIQTHIIFPAPRLPQHTPSAAAICAAPERASLPSLPVQLSPQSPLKTPGYAEREGVRWSTGAAHSLRYNLQQPAKWRKHQSPMPASLSFAGDWISISKRKW